MTTFNEKPTSNENPDFSSALSSVIKDLKWFWSNPLVRKYLFASALPRNRIRVIEQAIAAADTETERDLMGLIDELAAACLDLAECIEKEVKPILDLEARRAGPARDSRSRTELELTRSTIGANTDTLVRDVRILQAAETRRGRHE